MTLLAYLRMDAVEIGVRGGRYLLYLLAAAIALLVAGSIIARSPSIRVALFAEDHGAESRAEIRDWVGRFPDIEIIDVASGPLAAETLRKLNAGIGIGMWGGEISVLTNEAAAQQQDLRSIALAFALSFSSSEARPLDSIGIELLSRYVPLRGSALPRTNRTLFVPRVIALLAIFAPFMIALESYVRQYNSRTLHVQLAARGGGFALFALSKLIVSTVAGICVLLSSLLVANAVFGVTPSAELNAVVLVFGVGGLTSACIGLFVAMAIGPSRQIFGSIVAFFFFLITFSGFILPLEAADQYIQIGSALSPLTYPLIVLENWIVQGQGPSLSTALSALADWLAGKSLTISQWSVLTFAALAAVSLVAVAFGVISARRRL